MCHGVERLLVPALVDEGVQQALFILQKFTGLAELGLLSC